MNKKRKSLLITSLILTAALLLAGLGVNAVLAEEYVEFTGEVAAIDESAGTLTLEVEEDGSTTSYTVLLPDDFDYSRIEVGDIVEAEGTLNDAGEIVLSDLDVEGEEEAGFTGEVTAIDESAGTLTLEVEEDGSTTTYTVLLPDDFDYSRVEIGDTVEVEGTMNDAGEIVLSDLDVEEEEEEEEGEAEDEEGDKTESSYCEDLDSMHPAGEGIANKYDVEYSQVMEWFCEENFGFGEIKHALRTAENTGENPQVYLDMRTEGMGWGEIWKELDLIGKDRSNDADPSGGNGKPEHAGPPEGKGKGNDQ